MLSEATLFIRQAEARAIMERGRRSAARRGRATIERYCSHLEELVFQGAPTIAPGVLDEIRVFVTARDPELAHRIGRPAATLDVLFDLQERMEARDRRRALDVTGHVA